MGRRPTQATAYFTLAAKGSSRLVIPLSGQNIETRRVWATVGRRGPARGPLHFDRDRIRFRLRPFGSEEYPRAVSRTAPQELTFSYNPKVSRSSPQSSEAGAPVQSFPLPRFRSSRLARHSRVGADIEFIDPERATQISQPAFFLPPKSARSQPCPPPQSRRLLPVLGPAKKLT